MSEIITIKNEYLTVKISTYGAEISSIINNKNGEELIWQGGGGFWGGKAPNLFPVCGCIVDEYYTYKDKKYEMKAHGFGWTSEYEVVNAEKTQATFMLSANSETKKVYPFDFNFKILFKLNKNSLGVYYIVENISNEEMYFNVGCHESYNLKGDFKDYTVEFADDGELVKNTLAVDDYIGYETEDIKLIDGKLSLADFFIQERDGKSVIIDGVKSKRATLYRKDEEVISIYYNDFEHMVLWTEFGAPFIAIEPWNGLPDLYDTNHKIEEKKSIDKVEAKSSKTFYHNITFIEADL